MSTELTRDLKASSSNTLYLFRTQGVSAFCSTSTAIKQRPKGGVEGDGELPNCRSSAEQR
jgi:hypothetical protein